MTTENPELTVDARPDGDPQIQSTADVDRRAEIGNDTIVWHLAQVREYAQVGPGCTLGRGSYVGPGVILGRDCKIQNYALIYEPALLEDGVFVGPAVVFTNDLNPRAVTPAGAKKTNADWEPVGVTVRSGASVGARAVCVAPVTIGRWAMVAAGAVVTRNVPDFALVAGIPAQQIGWVGRAGVRLQPTGDDTFSCPSTGETYRLDGEGLVQT